MKIAPKKINAIVLIVAMSIFIVFITVNEQKYHTRQHQYLLDHTKVIADSIWDFEREGPEAYLHIAAQLYSYDTVSVFYLEDEDAFLTVKGPEVNRLDTLLIQIGLIPKHVIEADIFYQDRKIAILKVVALHKTFHLYFLIFLFLSVFLIAVRFFILTIYAKQILEDKVLERTKKLSQSEEKYRELVEGTQDLIVSTDDKGQFTFLNNMAATILGITPDEGIGLSAFNFIYPDDVEHTVKWFNESVDKKQNSLTIENRQVNQKTGEVRDIMWSTSFHYNELGKVVNVSGVGRDITEKKEAEEKRIQLEKQLRQSQKMESIGTLAGGIAHDFNNILSSVLGFTELALDDVDKETPVAKDLQEAYAAGLRAKDLVNQILTFARQSDEELKPTRLSHITQEVLKFIRSSIPTTIEIKQDIQSNSFIMANSTELHRIMMNLCTNAAHAMEDEGGTLEITLKDIHFSKTTMIGTSTVKPGDYIEIKVSDTGDGIEPQVIPNIFDPYFTTKAPGEGTGMGLAMVHGIVETYDGKILVESTLGKGTVFTIYLPTGKNSEVQPNFTTAELPTGQERILYVDDEVQIVNIARRVLEQLGYSVTTKTDSVEALELFRSKPDDFDLVMSDVTMPQMTGDQLTTELLQIRPDIPVILCTGYSKKLSEEKAAEIGIKAFVYKPIIKEELAMTVRSVLDFGNDVVS